MGLLFHSICRPASYRPQLHTCKPATVTLHTSLQPASATLPLTADTSCSSSDTHLKNEADHRHNVCGWDNVKRWCTRLQRSLADAFVNSPQPYLLAESIVLPTLGAATVIFILIVAEPGGLALKNFLWNDFGSISEPNNNFMAGQSQSNYIWPRADTSISTRDAS